VFLQEVFLYFLLHIYVYIWTSDSHINTSGLDSFSSPSTTLHFFPPPPLLLSRGRLLFCQSGAFSATAARTDGVTPAPLLRACESYSTPSYIMTDACHRETTMHIRYICKGDILTSDKINYVSIDFFSLMSVAFSMTVE
jgi:hypothetical protein